MAKDLLGIQPLAPYGVFSTFGASSPEKGQAAVSVLFEKSGEPDFYRYTSLFSIGLTNSMEVGLGLPYVDDEDEDGLEDVALSFKHRFVDEDKVRPAIAYLVVGGIDSGSGGYSTDGFVGAGIIVSKRVGPVNGHLNFIYSAPGDPDLEDEARFSGGLDFAAAHNFKLLAEIYGEKGFYSDDIDQLEARFGYRFQYGDGIYSALGVGFGMGDRTPDYRLMFSMTLIFPRIEKPIEKVYE